MSHPHLVHVALGILAACAAAACDGAVHGGADAPAPADAPSADAPTRAGLFPDIAELARQVGPVLAPPTSALRAGYTPAADWAAAERALYDVLGDASDLRTAPITRVHALVSHAQWLIDEINRCHFGPGGEPTACTPVPPGTAVEMPWMTAHGERPFFEFDDTGVYRCSFPSRTGGRVFFGRTPIAAAPASCTDPFDYHFLDGEDYSEPNPDQPESRGEMRTISQGFRVHYDGCTKDLQLVYAHASGYTRAGVPTLGFSSRSELIGNAASHEFRLRIAKLDGLGPTMRTLMTTEAAGRSRGDDPTVVQHLLISLRRFGPDPASAPFIDQRFCLEVRGTVFSPASSGCEAYDVTFASLPPLSLARVPRERFPAEFGAIAAPSGPSRCGQPARDGGASADGGRQPLQGHSILGAAAAQGPHGAAGQGRQAPRDHDGPEPAALRPRSLRRRPVSEGRREQRDQRPQILTERRGDVVVGVERLDHVLDGTAPRTVPQIDLGASRAGRARDLPPGAPGLATARTDARDQPQRIAHHSDAQHDRARPCATDRIDAQPQPDAAVEPARGHERLEHLGRRLGRQIDRGIQRHGQAKRVQRGLALPGRHVGPAQHALPGTERLARQVTGADLGVGGDDGVLVARLRERQLRRRGLEERQDDQRAHRAILPSNRPRT